VTLPLEDRSWPVVNEFMNNQPAKVVSLHPYFKVHPGKLEEFKALSSTLKCNIG
jgi:hypothetical protein